MAKEAYYFSHDSNAQDDPKCLLMIDQLGMEGYGIFWALIEKLRNESTYRLPFVILPALAKRWGTSTEKIKTVVQAFGLFEVDGNDFFSLRLLRNMQEKSEKGRIAAAKRWGNDASAMQVHTNRNATAMQNDASKVKESKVKESKEKDIIQAKQVRFAPPTRIEIITYLIEEKNFADFPAEGFADKFLNYYQSNGWKVSRNPMKDWKAAVNTWIIKNNEYGTYPNGASTRKSKQPTAEDLRDFINS